MGPLFEHKQIYHNCFGPRSDNLTAYRVTVALFVLREVESTPDHNRMNRRHYMV
jgi:hypothetical protein